MLKRSFESFIEINSDFIEHQVDVFPSILGFHWMNGPQKFW